MPLQSTATLNAPGQDTAPLCSHKEKEIPFEIQTLQQYGQYNAAGQGMPHRHPQVEIIWVRSGNGSLDIDMKRYKLGNNMLYCIVPGQLHQLEIENAEGYIISFPEKLLNSGSDDFELMYRSGLFHLLMSSPGVQVEQETADEFNEIGKRLHRELHCGYLLSIEIIKRYTSIFLIYLARQFEGSIQQTTQNRNVSLVKNFISLVEKKYTSWKLVKNYAGELSVTPNYLNEVVKKISGYPAGHHIRQRIVLEAKRQAACPNTSMKEIAYHLGFDDIAHFSKFFKSVYGKNFTDFRKER
ncbi:MAG: AraC family transcriptional regulator [Bacteroidetes bacterium]|nr:AraC family transcriptional regulator [Bacteroidota bacterium]